MLMTGDGPHAIGADGVFVDDGHHTEAPPIPTQMCSSSGVPCTAPIYRISPSLLIGSPGLAAMFSLRVPPDPAGLVERRQRRVRYWRTPHDSHVPSPG
jgi:hypothetical protein